MDRNDLPLPQFVAAIADNLFTAVVSDVLDELGYRDLNNAFAKVTGEDRTREALRKGAKLRDVFAEFHVL